MQSYQKYIVLVLLLLCSSVYGNEEQFFISSRGEELEQTLKKINSLAEQKQWEEVAILYNKILEENISSKDFVVQTDSYLYRNTREVVWENFTKHPKEFLEVYRSIISSKAETLAADKKNDSLVLLNKFLHTETGEKLLLDTCDNYILKEEYETAIHYILIYFHYVADKTVESNDILARLAFCYFATKDHQGLKSVIDSFKVRIKSKKVRIGGTKQNILRYTQKLYHSLQNNQTVSTGGYLLGSNSRRNFIDENLSFPSLKLHKTTNLKMPLREVDNSHYINEPSRNQEGPTQYYPTIGENLLFINNGKSVIAYELPSLRIKWQYEGLINEIKSDWHEQVIHSVTYHDGSVYANIEGYTDQKKETWNIYLIRKILAERRLVKLDAKTGRVLWIVKEDRLNADQKESSFESKLSFMTSPIIWQNKLIIGATELSGLFNSYVLALDIETGKTLWSKLVGSAHQELNLFGRPVRESVGSCIANANGKIYYLTNLGAVVGLNPEKGNISWIHTYDRIPLEKPRDALFHTIYRETGWYNSPVMVSGNYLYIAPIDSNYLYCINSINGERVWRKPRSSYQHYLLGIQNNKIFIGGKNNISILDATSGNNLTTLTIMPDDIAGFGIISNDTVYIPGKQYLYSINVNNLTVKKDFWPISNSSGHIVTTNEIMVTVSSRNVSTFFDFPALERKYQKSIQENSKNIDAYIQLADLYTNFNEQNETYLKKAEELYAQAKTLLPYLYGREQSYKSKQLNQKLLAAYYELAQYYKSKDQKEKTYSYYKKVLSLTTDKNITVPLWLELYEYYQSIKNTGEALGCLTTLKKDYGAEKYNIPNSNEEIRIDLYTTVLIAKFYADMGNIHAAVHSYQELISLYGDGKYNGNSCHQYGFSEIETLIEKHGRDIYKQYEEEAYKIHQTSNSFQVQKEIIQKYPNSEVASRSSILIAQNLIEKGLLDSAIEHLNTHIYRYSDRDNIAQAYYLLVRSYEQKELYTSSFAILHTMKKKIGDKEVEINGQKVKVYEYVNDALSNSVYETINQSPIPQVEIDFNNFIKREFSLRQYDYPKFVDVKGNKPKEFQHLIFLSTSTASGRMLYCYDTKNLKEIWTQSLGWPIRGVSFVERNILVWNNEDVYYLNPNNGEVIWKTEIKPSIVDIFIINNKIVTISCDNRQSVCTVTARQHDTGNILWEQKLEATTSMDTLPEAVVSNELFIISFVRPAQMIVIDVNNGKIKKVFSDNRFHNNYYFFPVLLNNNYLAVVKQNKFIECYRIPTLEKIWEVEEQDIEKTSISGNDLYISWGTQKRLVVADITSGNEKWSKNRESKSYIQKVIFDFNIFYFVERDLYSEWKLWSYDLDNPNFMWYAFLGKSLSFTNVTVTQRYMVCMTNMWSRGNRSRLLILDKFNGKLLKDYNVNNGDRGPTPASIEIIENEIWLLKDKNIWIIGK